MKAERWIMHVMFEIAYITHRGRVVAEWSPPAGCLFMPLERMVWRAGTDREVISAFLRQCLMRTETEVHERRDS